MKRLVWLSLCSLLWSCSARQATQYRILVRVESDPGVPLAGAVLRRETRELARSDERGELATALHGQPGDRIRLDVTCPAGYRQPRQALWVMLRGLAARDGLPEFQVQCAPLARNVVVAVRAQHGPNLPLRYLGQEIARTDGAGAAHALLRAAPGDTLTLTLDTTAADSAKLMPQQPELRFTMPEHDELVVFDQAFSIPRSKPKPRRVPKPTGPQKI